MVCYDEAGSNETDSCDYMSLNRCSLEMFQPSLPISDAILGSTYNNIFSMTPNGDCNPDFFCALGNKGDDNKCSKIEYSATYFVTECNNNKIIIKPIAAGPININGYFQCCAGNKCNDFNINKNVCDTYDKNVLLSKAFEILFNCLYGDYDFMNAYLPIAIINAWKDQSKPSFFANYCPLFNLTQYINDNLGIYTYGKSLCGIQRPFEVRLQQCLCKQRSYIYNQVKNNNTLQMQAYDLIKYSFDHSSNDSECGNRYTCDSNNGVLSSTYINYFVSFNIIITHYNGNEMIDCMNKYSVQLYVYKVNYGNNNNNNNNNNHGLIKGEGNIDVMQCSISADKNITLNVKIVFYSKQDRDKYAENLASFQYNWGGAGNPSISNLQSNQVTNVNNIDFGGYSLQYININMLLFIFMTTYLVWP